MNDKLHDDNMRMLAERAAERKSAAPDRDDLAAILAKHREWWSGSEHEHKGCSCDTERPADWQEMGWMERSVWYRAHVAQMVLESDWLRGVRAKELRDAADAVYGDERAEGDFSHPLSVRGWLRDRADRFDAEDGGR